MPCPGVRLSERRRGTHTGVCGMPYYPTRKLTILALDPSVKDRGRILKTQIDVPNELLAPGPRGYRVFIIDYDSSTGSFRRPKRAKPAASGSPPSDPFEKYSDSDLLSSPEFRSFMTYGIVMKTLSRFEYALGRRLSWSFGSHQIQVAPHAFSDANAFYSDRAQGLFFGYFPSTDGQRTLYTCLSHEIVAHETTHALLDGLRERYTDPSSPEQAGFHEGFADVVALLSVFSLQPMVGMLLDFRSRNNSGSHKDPLLVDPRDLTLEKLRKSVLLGLAEQMGKEMSGVRGNRGDALRR